MGLLPVFGEMNSHDSESKEYSVAISVTDSCRTLTNEDSMTGIPASKVALSPIGREKALASSFPDSKMHTTRASDDDDLESGRFSEETSTVNPLNTLYSDRGLSLLKPADLKNQDWEHGRVLSEARFRSSMGSVSERVPSVRVPRQNSNPTTTAEIEAARILTEVK